MNIKKSFFPLVGVIVVLTVVLGIYVFFVRGTVQHIDWLRVSNIEVNNETITINAFNPNSAKMVSGYDYYVKDTTVYVKPRMKYVIRIESLVTESIVINDDFSNINEVVLLGKSNQSKPIWNKTID